MIGVVVPAHDEQACIGACLASILRAARCPALAGERVEVIVALDRCSDRTGEISAAAGAQLVSLHAGNVGMARAAGAAHAIAGGARWIACTDADTTVPADWLSGQLAHGGDAFCGLVDVDDWRDYVPGVRERFGQAHPRRWEHPHVHGANLGFTTALYRACGGFAPLPAHEDVALVAAMARCGARIVRAPTPVVTTSARRTARARGGFADYLVALEGVVRDAVQGLGPAMPEGGQAVSRAA